MPYRQTIQELEAATLTNAREGLSEKEAAARLQRFGCLLYTSRCV